MKNFLGDFLENKEELIIKFLELMEGKEAKALINLDGIEFKIGKSMVKVNGAIDIIFVPFEEKKKKGK